MKVKGLLWIAATCSVFASGSSVGADAGGCRNYVGEFTNVLIPPPACTSPVGVCTHGLLTGDVSGTYDFVMATLVPADPDDPNQFAYTGDSVVTTDRGVIQTADTGVIDLNPADTVHPFVTTAQFVSGTRRYKNAGGVFVATGAVNFLTGEGSGDYSLQICHGN